MTFSDSIADELHTLADYIRWGASQFNQANLYYGHGTNNAVDESLTLVLHALHLKHGLAPELFSGQLTSEEKQAVLKLFRARIEKRLPVPYITHEAMFAGESYFVDERVLVPRSPIAELIAEDFAPWIEHEQVMNILDLCTGSGCIGIACAKAFPWAQVDASDLSAEALEVAEINVQAHGVGDQVALYESDLFSNLPDTRYDIIVSNPPYVDSQDMADLPEEYQREPELALASGDDGLDACVQILIEAKNYLSEQGILIIEVGNSAEALAYRFPEVPFLWLDFERGGHGVFLLTAAQCQEFNPIFIAESRDVEVGA